MVAAGKPDDKADKAYEDCVDTVRKTMLALLAFCMFCVVTVFATPDAALIGYSASHGCIRMLILDATWLFDHVSIGTSVLIVG